MKNIEITESIIYQGEHCAKGSVLKNVDNGIAAELITSGRAKELKPETTKIVVPGNPEEHDETEKAPTEKKVKGKKDESPPVTE